MRGTVLEQLGFTKLTSHIYSKEDGTDTKKMYYYKYNKYPVVLITDYRESEESDYEVFFFENRKMSFTDADHLGRFLTELKRTIHT